MIFFSSSLSSDIYSQKCVGCHRDMPYSLQEIFMKYLLAYGGENNVKAGMLHYFIYPSKDISVMPKGFLDEKGIMDHGYIGKENLQRSIDRYWELYKVKGRLK